MFDNYMEDFQEFDRYCRYNHYTYELAISDNQVEIIDENALLKKMAETKETNKRIFDLEILRFNTLKSKNNKSKKNYKEDEKKEN